MAPDRPIKKFLQCLTNATQNTTFNTNEITDRSCDQFKMLLENWQNHVRITKENNQTPATLSVIELIAFNEKLQKLVDKNTVEYQTWTATVRAVAYGAATGVTVGMVIADIFGCLGKLMCFKLLENNRFAGIVKLRSSYSLLLHSVPIRGVRGTFRGFEGRDRIRTCADFGEKF